MDLKLEEVASPLLPQPLKLEEVRSPDLVEDDLTLPQIGGSPVVDS